MPTKFYFYYDSPIGKLKIVEESNQIIEINKNEFITKDEINEKTLLISQTLKELEEYFNRQRTLFTIPINQKGTLFQQKVWKALQEIPYGTTKSYKEIALTINCPKGYRAVGHAANQNKILIVIPCHRLIGQNKKLTGFALGINNKEYLLNIEKQKEG